MLANVFSNTTPPRVEEAEGVPLLGFAPWPPLRLWPSSPARHFNNIARRLMGRRAISTERVPALAAGRATQVQGPGTFIFCPEERVPASAEQVRAFQRVR
jgi:hypothetical protein